MSENSVVIAASGGGIEWRTVIVEIQAAVVGGILHYIPAPDGATRLSPARY